MIKQLIYIAGVLLVLSSCFKEDDPLPAPTLQTTTIEMNKYYLYQSYFDLNTDTEVARNEKNDWDIGFESRDSSWHIVLNTSAFMYAANTGETDFEAVTDTTGLIWKFDKSDGNPDSTAVGNWLDISNNDTTYSNKVYVLDRGYDELGILRGLRKIVFTHVDLDTYAFKYADLDGENYNEFVVVKSDSIKYAQFSFEDGGKQVYFEPIFLSWDLLFTQYTTLLFTDEGDPYPYLVTGVLTNYDRVEVAMDSAIDFENIDLNYAMGLEFSKNQDAIGYDWKDLKGDLSNPYYEIVEGRNYIIKNRFGLYAKFRFISFYSNEVGTEGDKGYPTFQYLFL